MIDLEFPMLYTNTPPQSFFRSGEEDFKVVLPYMGAESFEKIINTFSTEGPVWNLVKTAQAVSEKTFNNYIILYLYIVPGQGQITLKGQNFDCN